MFLVCVSLHRECDTRLMPSVEDERRRRRRPTWVFPCWKIILTNDQLSIFLLQHHNVSHYAEGLTERGVRQNPAEEVSRPPPARQCDPGEVHLDRRYRWRITLQDQDLGLRAEAPFRWAQDAKSSVASRVTFNEPRLPSETSTEDKPDSTNFWKKSFGDA